MLVSSSTLSVTLSLALPSPQRFALSLAPQWRVTLATDLLRRYELTVRHLEPSYVIQRFLDVQRLHALTRYLERLHSQVGLAAAEMSVVSLEG